MPAYNADRFISNSINSVINQTYQNWELLIVDDNSSDNTYSIAKEISRKDKRIKIYQFNSNKGASLARELAYTKSKGDYVAFLDADDLWDPDKLHKQLDFMQKNGYTFSYTRFNFLHGDGHFIENKMTDTQYTFSSALVKRGIGCLTVMVCKELLTDDIISQNNKKHGEDYLWWLLIMRSGVRAYGLKEALAFYRITNNTLSSHKFSHYTTLWKTYRNDLSLPTWFVLRCFVLLALQKLIYWR